MTTYEYDRENREISVEFADEKTTKMYDAVGNPGSITMPEGNCRIMEYDKINRLVKVIDDPTSPQSEIGFDPRRDWSDDLNLVTSYMYDDNGNLRHQFDPRGNHTEYIYDELNRKEEELFVEQRAVEHYNYYIDKYGEFDH